MIVLWIFQYTHLNFPSSACTASSPCQFLFITWSHLELYRQYFFVSRGLRHCHSDFPVITHLPSQMSQYATRTSVCSKPLLPLCSKRLCWLVLTMIASEMSPLKQQAWQDCGAFSLWGVQQKLAVHYASLIANHPTDTRHVYYGTDGFQPWVGCQSQVSFGIVWIVVFFCEIHRWIGSSFLVFAFTFVKDDIWSSFYPVWENITSIQIPQFIS